MHSVDVKTEVLTPRICKGHHASLDLALGALVDIASAPHEPLDVITQITGLRKVGDIRNACD